MAHFTRHSAYRVDKPIWAFPHGIRKPNSASIDRTYLSADKEGNKTFPAGSFVAYCRDGNNDLVQRILPRGKVKVASTLASARFKVNHPYFFVPGDVLYIHEPYATFTVASTAVGSLSVNGRVISYTPVGAANATEAAEQFAAYFNESPFLSRILHFVASGTSLHAVAKDGFSLIEITPTGSLGTVAATTAANATAIGTVLTIDTVTEEIVLVANAAVAVPIGFNVGVPVESVYGILDISAELSTDRPSVSLGLGTEGSVYKGSLPYWDDSINVDLPNLQVQYRF